MSIDGTPVEGASTAPVVLIEWSDYQCAYCAVAERDVIPALRDVYIQTGKVQFAFRHLPSPTRPRAQVAAQAALCAGAQGRFWDMHRALFAQQASLDDASLSRRARALSIDESRFQSCLSGEPDKQIARDVQIARELRLTGTPTFVIGRRLMNGEVQAVKLISGARPASEFIEAIDSALAVSGLTGRLWPLSGFGALVAAVVLGVAVLVVRGRRLTRNAQDRQPS